MLFKQPKKFIYIGVGVCVGVRARLTFPSNKFLIKGMMDFFQNYNLCFLQRHIKINSKANENAFECDHMFSRTFNILRNISTASILTTIDCLRMAPTQNTLSDIY